MAHDDSLKGRIALVTGGARGIGAATARLLAERGADVHLSDVLDCEPVAASIRESGGLAGGHALDVTDRDACRRLIAGIVADKGQLDILVCNAGVCPAGTPAGETEQWDAVLDVNLNGTQNCIAASWDSMLKQGGGRVVIVSSMAFYQGGLIVGTEYTASKAGLIGMTRHLARNGGQHGIRVNAVAPGIIDTDMTAEFDKPAIEQVPLRRYGTAADVAGPIAFLCGDDSAYMTGAVLNVTGGMVLAA